MFFDFSVLPFTTQIFKSIMPNNQLLINALHSLLTRLDDIDSQCCSGFPLHAVGDSNEWLISQGGSWMGGFWAGSWWLRARLTGSTVDYEKAVVLCKQLRDKILLDSSYRSLIFWYGAALGDVWFHDNTGQQIAMEAAEALAADYDTALRCLPLGSALGGGDAGQGVITVDGLASFIDLLSYSGNSKHAALARQHTDTLLAVCLTETGAFHAEAHYKHGQFQATDRVGDWSRGQAWAMLGLTRAAHYWGEPYVNLARLACEYWLSSRPSLPLNRLSEPVGLIDASATVIASLAMLSLAEQCADGEQWREAAHQQLTALVSSDYFNEGVFSGCCYKIKPQQLALVESSWGTFLLLLALESIVNSRKCLI